MAPAMTNKAMKWFSNTTICLFHNFQLENLSGSSLKIVSLVR